MKRLASLFILLLAGSILAASAAADTGSINLGPEEILKAKGKDIVVPGYSVPSLADWNGDQLKDLIVGEGGGGYAGKIRVYLNVGTGSDPCFADYFYAQSYGQDLVFTPEGCMGCFPRVIDWYQDLKNPAYRGSKIDLLVGRADGVVEVFVNSRRALIDSGVDSSPSFNIGTPIMVGATYSNTLDVGARATPTVADWNNDGMLDVVVGGLDGGIHVYYNCGCGGYIPPRFSTSSIDGSFVQANGRDLLVPSGRSSPVIMDVDGDGKKDILTGNTDGQILFYRNVGTDSLPIFEGYTYVKSNGQPLDLAGGLRSRPFVCYWTGDGSPGHKDAYWDLLVGYGDGKIRLYRGTPKAGDFDSSGVIDAPDFTVLAKALDKPVPAQGSLVDLNKDGFVDVLDLRLFADLWLAEREAQTK